MSILSIDQGTTGTTTILYDDHGTPVQRAYREFPQHFPHPGWVEHDPRDIWQTVTETVAEITAAHPDSITAVGITNQRETTLLWNRRTGEPLHNAIVWQCRRTAPICDNLRKHEDLIRDRTGLPLDPYFSGTKIKWLLENIATLPPISEIAFGTIDSWLIWQLTGGKTHATDFSNASRTLLFNIDSRQWDSELCRLLDVPPEILPEVRASMADYGEITTIPQLRGIPVLGVAGDQQAALFGQTCFAPGETKNTYGTGCFLLMNTGTKRIRSKHGLLATLAVNADGTPCYALEGAVFIGGAAIQWLRDELQIISAADESEALALSLPDNEGVYFVPAFTGLGAPHWDAAARGIVTGLTRGSGRAHLARAALEAMAFQSLEVIEAMEEDTGIACPQLAVDGGATANNFLMQFQADILNRPVARPHIIESTSRGAAFLAGLQAGIWQDAAQLRSLKKVERIFEPGINAERRTALIAGWQHAVEQARL